MKKQSLLIGQFLPLHKGHEALILNIAKESKKCIIFIKNQTTHKLEKITTRDRYLAVLRFIENEQLQNTTAYLLDKDQTIESLSKQFPDLTHLASANLSHQQLAYHLNLKFTNMSKLKQNSSMISTNMRSCYWKQWHHLNEYMKFCLVKRICVYGPESCGKTTLARWLATQFDATFIPEAARLFLVEKPGQLTQEHYNLFSAQQYAFAFGVEPQTPFLVCDTDLMTTQIYAQGHFGRSLELVDRLQKLEHYDFYLLLAPTIPWINDQLRGNEQRHQIYPQYKERLLKSQTHFHEITTSHYQERQEQAIKAIQNFFTPQLSTFKNLQQIKPHKLVSLAY